MAPLVADGKVLVGNSGGEMGVRGWLAALDAGSGKIAWKAYSTGPDKDVLIGADYRPFYAKDRGHATSASRPGRRTIGRSAAAPSGAGSATIRNLKTIYYGTSNPGPWNQEQRPGDNKWTAGVFARDIGTGQARWFYQSTPHDLYDHDDINEILLVDYPAANGQRIPALIRPSRNGFFYVQDRRNGQVLSAKPYGYINVYKGVDLKTGQLHPGRREGAGPGPRGAQHLPRRAGRQGLEPVGVQPGHRPGLHPAPQPLHGHGRRNANYIAGTPFVGADVKMYAGPGGNRGVFTAWDPVAQRKVFEIKEDLPLWSPALATAGGARFLRNDGRLVQGDRRAHRQAAVAVQDRQRDHRPADQLSRARRPPIYRGAFGRRRLGGRDRLGKLDPRDPTGGARLRQCRQGPAEAHFGRRNGLCLRAAEIACLAAAALALLCRCDREQRDSRGKPLARPSERCAEPRHDLPRRRPQPPLDPRARRL